jgi:hypothetical protein
MASGDDWEDASSDEDYSIEEEVDSEAGDTDMDGDMDDDDAHLDPSPFSNPGLTQQLLQQFTGTGLFATLNEAFEEWDSLEAEDDYGIEQLLYHGELLSPFSPQYLEPLSLVHISPP